MGVDDLLHELGAEPVDQQVVLRNHEKIEDKVLQNCRRQVNESPLVEDRVNALAAYTEDNKVENNKNHHQQHSRDDVHHKRCLVVVTSVYEHNEDALDHSDNQDRHEKLASQVDFPVDHEHSRYTKQNHELGAYVEHLEGSGQVRSIFEEEASHLVEGDKVQHEELIEGGLAKIEVLDVVDT